MDINQTPLVKDALPAADFRRALVHERARADRNEHQFSVLLLQGAAIGGAGLSERLINRVARRIRTTDEMGWFDKRRIGVLLPYTPSKGALKLADDIRGMAMQELLEVTVYTYPGSWLPEETQPPRSDSIGGGQVHGDYPDQPRDQSAPILVGHPQTLFDDGMPFWKRVIDITVAAIALLLLLPLFVGVAATILAVSPGPVFLRQKRVGYQGKLFTIWKFRTMKVGADAALHQEHFKSLMSADLPLTKLDLKGDPRIIPLGNFIRRCCLDELPQLFNVLRGDMSLVGPRPCLSFAVSQYRPWQRMRCDAVPGMTGLWQVSGKNRTTFKEMIRLDIAYVRRRSPRLDLLILLRTLPTIFRELIGNS